MTCPNCGAEINDSAVVCQFCGKEVAKTVYAQPSTKSNKDWLTTLILCWFLGVFGVHRFYVGKTGSGVAQLITGGVCGIWTLVDLIQILLGKFEDAEGKVVSK